MGFPPKDNETLYREQLIGEVRGLRYLKEFVKRRIEELEAQLKT